jgi:hypothetical protein
VCACAAGARLAVPSTVVVNVVHDPSAGLIAGASTSLGDGEGALFDWSGFDTCVTERAVAATLPVWELRGDVIPSGPAQLILPLPVRVE